jgi:hypothetical protein
MADMKITFLFTTNPKSWLSAIIRWFTKSKTSHVAIMWESPSFGCRLALTADDNGFVFVPESRHIKGQTKIAEFRPIGPLLDEAFKAMVVKYLDTPYDFGAMVATGIKDRLKLIWKLFGRWIKRLPSSDKMMCSESVLRLLQSADYKSVNHFLPELTDAEQTLQAMKTNPEEFECLFDVG